MLDKQLLQLHHRNFTQLNRCTFNFKCSSFTFIFISIVFVRLLLFVRFCLFVVVFFIFHLFLCAFTFVISIFRNFSFISLCPIELDFNVELICETTPWGYALRLFYFPLFFTFCFYVIFILFCGCCFVYFVLLYSKNKQARQ